MVARWDGHGHQFESDPDFLKSVEDWIDGKMEIADLRTAYMELIRSRHRRLNK